jgi:hypothetical protein
MYFFFFYFVVRELRLNEEEEKEEATAGAREAHFLLSVQAHIPKISYVQNIHFVLYYS